MARRILNPRQALLPIFDDAEDGANDHKPDRPSAVPPATSRKHAPAPEEPAAVLDRTVIGAIVLREIDRALGLYPDWAHPFAGLSFNRARRCYGQAHRDGRIVLSTVFLGTTALDDLEDTVRHELAHLIAGIEERHGPRWRAVAKALGAVPRATGKSQSAELNARMDDAPWTLVAVLASGEERELKRAFRRNRRFVEYRLGAGPERYRCAGQDVLCFRYRRREPDAAPVRPARTRRPRSPDRVP